MEFRSTITNRIVTDREIAQALTCCDMHRQSCRECVYFPSPICQVALKADAQVLINRQRERIEALEFMSGHDLLAAIGRLEELKQFYGPSDISIGLTIAIDTIKKGVVSQP